MHSPHARTPSVALVLAFAHLAAPRGAAAAASLAPQDVAVHDAAGLRAALRAAGPGTRILVAPGTYSGGFLAERLCGTAERPVVLAGADPAEPPLFQGGACGLQLVDAAHVELRDLAFAGQTGNGLNLDDGGSPDTPAHHVTLRRIAVRDVGPRGNCDGIKLSGVTDFRLEDCTVERWGSGGSAVDMVGCRNGTIERCRFENPADSEHATGVQAKGGSRDVAIRRSRFVHAGSRAVNVGGSTGLEYFRPPLAQWEGPRFEAKDVVVEGCTFTGSDAPIALVGCDGARVAFNTLHRPGRWALRLLQETRAEGFVPARGGVFQDNLVVFESTGWREGGVNVGPGTEPGSLRFARNVWTCVDDPARSRALVRLPTAEEGGRYGVDPGFVDAAAGDLRLREESAAAGAGATAFRD